MAFAYSEVHEVRLAEPVRPFWEPWKMFDHFFIHTVTKVSLR